MTDRPRTFAELVAAMNPAERGRLERAEHYADHTVKNDFHAQVWLLEDRDAPGEWRVEYQDEDGGGYVTIFAGPAAERRARTSHEALQAKRLPTIREGAPVALSAAPRKLKDNGKLSPGTHWPRKRGRRCRVDSSGAGPSPQQQHDPVPGELWPPSYRSGLFEPRRLVGCPVLLTHPSCFY